MFHSCLVQGTCYLWDPESQAVHVCSDPHILCKTRNVSQIPCRLGCIPIHRSQDAIFQPCEWHILERKNSADFFSLLKVKAKHFDNVLSSCFHRDNFPCLSNVVVHGVVKCIALIGCYFLRDQEMSTAQNSVMKFRATLAILEAFPSQK